MSRLLNDLAPVFKPLAFELLARFTEQQLPVMIITTRRSVAEQADAVARGVSWTLHSPHLYGLAIDVAPFSQWLEFGDDKLAWNLDDPQWPKLGAIGRALGLQWGIIKDGAHMDLGHFQYVAPAMLKPGEPTGRLS